MTASKLGPLIGCVVALALSSPVARGAGEMRAREAREATLALDVKQAHDLLDDVDSTDLSIVLERARLALYEGNYDGASILLSKPELERTDAGAELLAIANGCARATAASVIENDVERGIFL